jgi:hypothetical protein
LDVLAVTALCGACGAIGRGDEPLGVRLDANGGVPALDMAFTLEPPGVADRMVAPLTSALHRALVECASSGYAALHTGIALGFQVHDGRLRAQDEPAEPLARCVSEALTRASIAALPDTQALQLRVRAARSALASGELRSSVHAP